MNRPQEPQRHANKVEPESQVYSSPEQSPDHGGRAPSPGSSETSAHSSSLDGVRGDGETEGETATQPSSRSVVVTVSDPRGLHLRSGRDVVRTASRFQSQITASNLSRNTGAVDLKSILQLMQLQARQGHDLKLAASGPDAIAAIDALSSLF